MTDGQLVGLILIAAMVAPCLMVAWEAHRAPLRDNLDPAVGELPLLDGLAALQVERLMPEIESFLSEGRRS